jgi:hypothetical protein
MQYRYGQAIKNNRERKLKRPTWNSHDPPYRYLNDNIDQGGQEVGEQTSVSGSSSPSFLCPRVSHTELFYKVLNIKNILSKISIGKLYIEKLR